MVRKSNKILGDKPKRIGIFTRKYFRIKCNVIFWSWSETGFL